MNIADREAGGKCIHNESAKDIKLTLMLRGRVLDLPRGDNGSLAEERERRSLEECLPSILTSVYSASAEVWRLPHTT